MKLTKKLESEILKVYNAYWDSYFKGDMQTFASLLHENVQIIGSSVNETFLSKKAALKFYKNTAGQVAGKAGVRNRKITMQPVDNNILVIEQSDFYALIDNEWSFYGNGRISTLLHKTNNGWKIIHEHGSLPDSKAGEGEQLNTEKIKAENIQLRDAIKRRTIELEQKNSELKVETSLERVRAVAMGMNESDDLLRICEVSFKEFQKLGFGNIRNAVIHILNDEKKVFLDYDYSDYLGGSINNIDYNSHPVVEDYLRQIKKADDAFAQVVIEGNELESWKEFRRSSGQLDDPRLNETKALHYYLYSIGVGDIGISAFGPIDDSQIKILKRFRNVFDLAYKRYNDIALAEAQAKEAQIEAALERVRSRTMGMQKSEELKEVIRVVYEQFVNLKINVDHAGFVVDYTPKGDWHFWIADEQDIPSKITHPYFESVWANQFIEAKEKGADFFVTNLNFEEKNKFYNELLSYVPGLPDASKDFYLSCPGLAATTVLFDNVSLYIENFSGIPYSDEDNNTLMRFGKVFQQTYTRFNDLKQAEAQAKESQIEAALERVRSRTMAMHQSSELAETAFVLFKQLIELGVEPNRLYIAIVKDETGKAEFWITDEDGSKVSSGFSAKLNDNSSFNKMFEGWKKKNKSLTIDMHGKELQEYFEHLGKLNVPFKSGLSQKRRVQHIAYFSQGFIGIASPDLQSEETVNLLERFAAVFNLTYRRFLDLQKAEAQAREAQIELGLERVRARAMAMHKSEELSELVDTVFKELTKLDFTLKWCIINIIDESTMSNTVWAANPDINKTPESYHMLFEDYPFHNAMMKGYKERATKYIYVLEGIEKKVYDEYLFNETEFRKVPATAQAASRAMEKYVVTFSFSNFGGLQTVGEVPLSDTNIDILSRFGKVFDLTYTRFNDLKKAEVQARESQIEAALERVRAKAMAMHTSNDLSDTMGVVFTELPKLGINSLRCGVVLLSKDSHLAVFYAAATTSESDSFTMIGTGNMAEHHEFVNQYEFWLRNENYFTTLSDEELQSYYEALFARLTVPYKPREHKVQTEHGYYFAFSAGMFYAWAETPYSENEINILNRFKAIIDLTFRRYLDLQKAEAQAREAQIELALERVRARTMAMHKSEELSETAHELFQQFKEIDKEPKMLTIGIMNENEGLIEFWVTDWSGGGSKVDRKFNASIDEPILLNKIYTAWMERQKSIVIELSNEELLGWVKYRISLSGVPDKTDYSNSRGFVAAAFFSKGMLSISTYEPFSPETILLLERFAGVFNLTYTRFLDLQKAEAQARESQIETNLERVRARTMAMHKSEELAEVVAHLFEQLDSLGIKTYRCNLGIVDESLDNIQYWATTNEGKVRPVAASIPISLNIHTNKMYEGWKNQRSIVVIKLLGKERLAWTESVSKYISFTEYQPENIDKEKILNEPAILSNFYFKQGFFAIHTLEELDSLSQNIISRFAKVFEQTYTRFQDLIKAEAQAREAQIELALERVRARTMAMQKSEELAEAAYVLFQQFQELGQEPEQFTIGIIKEAEHIIEFWHTWLGSPMEAKVIMTIDEPHVANRAYTLWKEQNKSAIIDLSGEDLKEYNVYRKKRLQEANVDLGTVLDEEQRRIIYLAFFSKGTISISTHEPRPAETIQLLERFAGVFNLTYTRFLDLQKAEAQAREARIEAALEKVRSCSLAMRKSDELQEVVHTVFEKLNELDVDLYTAIIFIFAEDSKDVVWWLANKVNQQYARILVPYTDNHYLKDIFEAKEKGKDFFSASYSFEEKNDLFHHLFENTDFKYVPEKQKQFLLESELATMSVALTKNTGINITNYTKKAFSEKENEILIRFAKVFDQAYTRFLDLQKAEAQAREAEIEAALERIRSRAMAIRKSDELIEVIKVIFQELNRLGIDLMECSIATYDTNSNDLIFWSSGTNDSTSPTSVRLQYFDHPHFVDLFNHVRNGILYQSGEYSGNLLKTWWDRLFVETDYKYSPLEFIEAWKQIDKIFYSRAFMNHGFLEFLGDKPLPEDKVEILKRFTKVVDLAYTRFDDVVQAETQAREAEIELSLERVRSKAMAMHSPNDLSETVNVFFKELKTLGIIPIRCGVGQIDEATRTTSLTTTTSSQQGDSFRVIGKIKQTGHPVLDGIFDHWKLQKEYHPVLQGGDIKAYYDVMNPQIGYPDYPEDVTQYGNCFYFKEGFVFAWTENLLSEEELIIFRRFTTVLSLTYRRYMDLKAAEVRAIEAVKQASLDRVRAEIASMRTSEDLNHITPIIWRELKNLEVPFFRCGVYIVEEANSKVQVYLTTPDGKPLAVLDLTLDSNELTKNTVEYWRKQKVYKDHWNKEEFLNWTKLMIEQGQVQNAETYQGSVTPPDSLYLHFVPFKQGMLYVGDTSPLPDEKLQLVKSLAETFSIAYSRYEDFKNLENAKAKVEVTLNELRSAQAQLIHSEKMASLGELTAGIAHEIKNPLNFVNNFSEVSRELLDEMKIEIQNNNIEEVIEIVEDLKQNLEKINQHGKRADSIVKGMLLHSRGTSGEKVLTNVNDLLDQYVTLAYHGLRAQNKEFNITIEKNYDDTLEKINVVPQDISRVFLNVINNACYAAFERKKKGENNFSPVLKVSTKKLKDNVEIRISDNGEGIPESIKKQIFNPFFTTKPTGEGTGLGLSLSYDIVTKVHGGNIKVESEEGKGAEFIIQLPLQ